MSQPMDDGAPSPQFMVDYETARETIHSAKRAGSPLKPEIIARDNFMMALGFLQGLAGNFVQQQEAGAKAMEGIQAVFGKALGVDEDD